MNAQPPGESIVRALADALAPFNGWPRSMHEQLARAQAAELRRMGYRLLRPPHDHGCTGNYATCDCHQRDLWRAQRDGRL